jgi:hypothetical protein
MFYDKEATDLPSGLGMSTERIKEIEEAFTKVITNLPSRFQTADLHEAAADIIKDVTDAYYIGHLVRGFLNSLESPLVSTNIVSDN